MKKIYLMLFAFVSLFLNPFRTNAQQVNTYSFSQSNGSYASIPEGTGTVVDSAYYGATANTIDSKIWSISLPFSFTIAGSSYSSLTASSNGAISFGTTQVSTTNYTVISSTGGYGAAIAAMNRDLWGAFISQGSITTGSNIITSVTDFYGIEVGKVLGNATGIPTGTTVTAFDAGAGTITMSANATSTSATAAIGWCNAEVRTTTTGSAPNRIFIVEWKDFTDYTTTVNSRSLLNFQVQLEETTNKISVVYGTNSQFVTTARTSQVGLRGTANTDYNNRSSSTTWSATIAGSSNAATVTRTDAINPASGLTFIWSPPTCFVPSGLTASALTTSSATISWTAPANTPENGYQYYLSTTNTAPTGAGTPNGTTSVNLSSLPANTTHYIWVRSACIGTDFSAWVGPLTFRTGYCIPSSTAADTYINNFSTTEGVTNISNLASGYTTGGYQDNYATMSASAASGNALNFNLALVGGSVGVAIWVDFNNNLQFESGERLFNTTSYTNGPVTGTITIPAGTTAGDYRMRVLIHYNASNPADACASNARLEAEDYKLTVVPPPTDAMDWVNLQFPATANINGGGSVAIYTQGYELGVTEAAGAGAGISVWIGVSTTNTDPSTWTTWIPATFNVQAGNNDEYMASIGSNLPEGTFYYASRWRLNGGPYMYGGFSGGFWDGTSNVNGVLTVSCASVPIPYTQNFDGVTVPAVPACMAVVNSNADAYQWVTSATSAASAPNAMYIRWNASAAMNDWFYTPGLELTGNVTYRLTFKENTGGGYTEKLKVMYGSSNTVAGMTEPLLDLSSLTNTSFATQTVDFTPASTGVYYIGFQGYSATNQYYLVVDDILVDVAPAIFVSAASGDWNAAATWVNNRVPDCDDNVVINNGHTVTSSTANNVSKTLTIRPTGALSVTGGDVTVGCTAKNNTLLNNGTVTVSAGTLKVNGNILANTGSFFNQSGGDIIVDGNDAGVAATSVAASTPIVSFQSNALNSVNLTGGTFTIVDPHASSTSTETISVNGSVIGPLNATAAHTFRFGDGVSTDPGGSDYGFRGNWWVNESGLPIGNMIIEGPTGTNRFVSSTYQLAVLKNITVNSGGELRTGNVYMGGNFIANSGGTITTTGTSTIPTVLLANVTYSTTTSGNFLITDAPDAQIVGGAGTFRNAATSPTASIRNLTVQNGNAAGVTLSAPIQVALSFVPAKGIIHTTTTNLLTVGTSGTSKGTVFQGQGWVQGPLKKWIGSTAGSDTLTVGTASLYKPAVLQFTAAPGTAGTITATFSAAAPNFPNTAPLTEGTLIVNKASNQGSWFLEAGDGLTGGTYTATFTGNGASDIIDYTKTVLIKRPTAGGDWTLDGTHVTTTGSNTAPVVRRTGMTGFSEFAIGGEELVALPITIEYFRGTKQSSRNVLDWKVTCIGSPSVNLQLERSADGRSYKAIYIATETAARCLQPFTENDLQPLPGLNYYRLKTIDVDGKIAYSNTVVLLGENKGFALVNLAPNPVKDKAVLTVTSAETTSMEIVIIDINGKQVNKQKVTLIAGSNQVPLELGKIAAGTYTVSGLTPNGSVQTIKFVKQ
ncbi:MAG: GEVED domain-containing protein [Ferruginibacter sp.]